MPNVRDLGAVGDGVTDDRAAFQAALDVGGEVYVPDGTYLIGAAPGCFWCLHIAIDRTRLVGQSRSGTVLQVAPGVPDSVQLLEVNAAEVSVSHLTLSGDSAHQTVSPHQQRHGLRLKGAVRCSVSDVLSRDFTGDGFYVYIGSDDARFSDCLADSNQRNGITLGGGTTGGVFSRCQFLRNGAQQFDSEGGAPINDVTITDCIFDALGASNDYVLTMTGTATGVRSRGWTVTHNTVNGAALVVWMDDLVYAYNTGRNSSTKPSIRIYRACDRILIHRNTLQSDGVGALDVAAMVYITGTGIDQSPGGIIVSQNEFTSSKPCNGLSAVCCRDLDVIGNRFTGAGQVGDAGFAGIWLRTTRPEEPMQRVSVTGNQIARFGVGLMVGGNGTSRIQRLDVLENAFSAVTAAMSLDYADDHPVLDALEYGNTVDGGAVLVSIQPTGAIKPWGDGSRWTVPA